MRDHEYEGKLPPRLYVEMDEEDMVLRAFRELGVTGLPIAPYVPESLLRKAEAEIADEREKVRLLTTCPNEEWECAKIQRQLQSEISIERERNAKLVAALENFKLGHEHGAGLSHIRVMGDTYGWCDYCHERVSFGPGDAEQALDENGADTGGSG